MMVPKPQHIPQIVVLLFLTRKTLFDCPLYYFFGFIYNESLVLIVQGLCLYKTLILCNELFTQIAHVECSHFTTQKEKRRQSVPGEGLNTPRILQSGCCRLYYRERYSWAA